MAGTHILVKNTSRPAYRVAGGFIKGFSVSKKTSFILGDRELPNLTLIRPFPVFGGT